MKKKILLGTLSTLAIAAPIAAVVSCGDYVKESIPKSNYREKTLEMFHAFLKRNTDDGKFKTESILLLDIKEFTFKKGEKLSESKDKIKEIEEFIKRHYEPKPKSTEEIISELPKNQITNVDLSGVKHDKLLEKIMATVMNNTDTKTNKRKTNIVFHYKQLVFLLLKEDTKDDLADLIIDITLSIPSDS